LSGAAAASDIGFYLISGLVWREIFWKIKFEPNFACIMPQKNVEIVDFVLVRRAILVAYFGRFWHFFGTFWHVNGPLFVHFGAVFAGLRSG
jgi:hypothetical protein